MTRRDYETLSSSEQEEALLLNSNTEQKTTYVYFLVFSVCLSGFLFGYDTGGKFLFYFWAYMKN